MEQSPWKPILIGALASFILLSLIFIFTLPVKDEFEPSETILEFKEGYILGNKDGKKIWEFHVESVKMNKAKSTSFVEGISKGRFFKDNKIIIKNLIAPQARVKRHSKNVMLMSKDKKKIYAEVSFEKNRGKTKFAKLIADRLNYFSKDEKSEALGNIRISTKKFKARATKLHIDHEEETAKFSNNVSAQRKDFSLKCNEIFYEANKKSFSAKGNINLRISGDPETKIKGDKLVFYTDENKDVTVKNNIEAVQPKKAISGDQIIYNNKTKKILASGNVKTVFEKAKVLIKEDTIKKLKSKEARESLEEKTLLFADNFEIYTNSKNAKGWGNVKVFQKAKEAHAENAIFNEKMEEIILTKNVYVKKSSAITTSNTSSSESAGHNKDDEWIKCDKLIISITEETFTALGGIEGTFYIKND
jgi:lipopolysaccharide assembly outer membrane protein LptD (OstA)